MPQVKVERLDHLGLIAGMIKELGIIELINQRIEPDEREHITPGEAIAGMVLNGLGFSNRPVSLTPQFFENKPVDVLFREGVRAEHFNRFKLGRSLDKVSAYGCALLFSELSLAVCQQEDIDLRFQSLDTTSFSLTGEYLPDSDEHAILVTHGYSKDHRPDLKQVLLELVVSQDGGIPLISHSWDGNASDTTIFHQRSAAMIKAFSKTKSPRYLIADSKLYTEANAANLAKLPFITRVPGTIKEEPLIITQAWQADAWQPLAEGYRYQRVELCHYGMAQRWLVIYSDAAWQRAAETLKKACAKEGEQLDKQLFHLQATRFDSQQTAQAALDALSNKLRYHRLAQITYTPHHHYAHKGRPSPKDPIQKTLWQIAAQPVVDTDTLHQAQQHKACFVLASPLALAHELSDGEVFTAYKQQSRVEQGFRFLKDPLFFVSSLFVTKPSRIQALLMVMTLALLVYAIAQRRLRQQLQATNQTLPNQIHQPTETPTLRWLFQLLEGINRVVLWLHDQVQVIIEGLTELHRKILNLFGSTVCQIYQISSA